MTSSSRSGQRIQRLQSIIELVSVVPEESDDVEKMVLEIFRHGEVIKQMALLSEREQQVLTLWAWDNMTYEEIGDRLGLTKEGIRGIVARGLRKLRNPFTSRSYR